ncbi:hypothetical protein ACIRLA_13600 [Streptomyces sp. NPDC102364]|uniref:hypothetical protein n=1 Tax=Streptomyces sp. NPDC102364 TaxID=3366161 RepID=UPI00381ECDCD
MAILLATLTLTFATLLVPARADPGPTPPSPSASTASTPSAPRSPTPSDTPTPCTSSDCIPQPPAPSGDPEPTAEPPAADPSNRGNSAPGGITGWIAKGITSALDSFFGGLVDAALNPLLDLLGRTLLTTPSPSSLPRLGELWDSSWQIAIACYGLLVAAAGVVLMAHGTVQTRYSVKELAPRIPLGFLAAGLSLFVAGKAVDLANAISIAVMSDSVDTGTASAALHTFVFTALSGSTGSIFFVLIGLVIAGTLAALLVGYAVRLALTVILIAGAPLALMCHALPQTEGIARWWWKAFGGVLAIQVVQSLALITALRLFLAPNAFTMFGHGHSGLVNLLVALALFYILFKIPFWILGSVRGGGHGRSLVGGLVRAYVAYRTFGALRGVTGRSGGRGGGGGAGPSPFSGSPTGPSNPSSSPAISPAAALRRTREAARLPGPTPGRAAGRDPRRAPGPPSFRAPTPASSTHVGDPVRADGSPPPLPTFRGPGEPGTPDSGPDVPTRPWPRPGSPPGPPVFRAPAFPAPAPSGQQASGAARARSDPGARPPGTGPGHPPAGRSVQPNRPPSPTTFRAPAPENTSGARPQPPRTGPPPPTTFRAPPPAPRPAPTSSRRFPPPPPRR